MRGSVGVAEAVRSKSPFRESWPCVGGSGGGGGSLWWLEKILEGGVFGQSIGFVRLLIEVDASSARGGRA